MISPIAVRLTKGDDLKLALQQLVSQHQINAGSIASCVGCFTHLKLRLAGASETLQLNEPLEIVSVMGTLTPDHQHVHLSVSRRDGSVVGGHLMEGCLIDTTAELIVHKYHQLSFSREHDPQTGYTELQVNPPDK
ncbi:DNA-binding protein [Vibrio brasiliensis]|uniref:PPC domain-containing DNA-binding protein n=1 Tax=Vibrio brasiliensis TaxID=170652 RepID=UPI001EFEAD9C|nr:PPC domain-containing DNA-binding protein [Vibrio brasiliensis]MCG9751042.1 DNA-binding protein [Vibrio brasiliensis]